MPAQGPLSELTRPAASQPEYARILDEILAEVEPCLERGEVARYIPELAAVDPLKLGLALCTVDGEVYTAGDAGERFSVQSIAKVFTLSLAMGLEGDRLWQRVGREPSGTAFNSLVQLEHEDGIPRNPFINAGALVVTDALLGHLDDPKAALLELVARLAGAPDLAYDLAVARSEAAAGHRNAALAHFLKSFDNLRHDAAAVLDVYVHHCALAMSCAELARAGVYLANGGRDLGGERVLSARQTKYVNSLMLVCGTYDAVGDFAYRVGLPGKSGVGGGILAVLPGRFSACVWSPRLNPSGNSLAGTRALELLTTKTALSIF